VRDLLPLTPAQRLSDLLCATAVRLGFDPPADVAPLATCPNTEVIPCGDGAVAFTCRPWATYLNAAFPPNDRRGYRQAYAAIQAGLRRYGHLTAVVHPSNAASVRVVLRLGGTPIGVDPEGFIHYDIGRNDHAQPSSPT